MCIVHKGFRGFRVVSPASISGGNLISFPQSLRHHTLNVSVPRRDDKSNSTEVRPVWGRDPGRPG